MFLKLAGYGIAAVGAIGGYANYKKLQTDVGESNLARAVLGAAPAPVANAPPVVAAANQLDADVSTDKHALLIDAGLVAFGVWLATRD